MITDDLYINEYAQYAAKHHLVEFWGCRRVTDMKQIQQACNNAADFAKMIIIDSLFDQHQQGHITGLMLLQQGHITIHVWPVRAFVAVDVFMGGQYDPADILPVLSTFFRPKHTVVSKVRRGIVRG